MKLIMPVAGESSRFPGMRPKWLLVNPTGNLMVYDAICGLDLNAVEEVVFVCREDHAKTYDVERTLARQWNRGLINKPFRIVKVETSASQPQTVALALTAIGGDFPFVVKDSDNHFRQELRTGNNVSVMHLGKLALVSAANKSYVELNSKGKIVNIVEKSVISNLFCVGGYSFASSAEYLKFYLKNSERPGLYISHLIYDMLLAGEVFEGLEVTDFIDWGTVNEWNRYRREYGTVFCDIDGTLVKSSSEFFEPVWGTTAPITENVAALNKLFDSGKVHVVLTTTRSSEFEDATRSQLASAGVKFHKLIFDLPHAKRVVVNDYSRTNQYPSCLAINLQRDDNNLESMLLNEFKP
jgi:hypothetical protein